MNIISAYSKSTVSIFRTLKKCRETCRGRSSLLFLVWICVLRRAERVRTGRCWTCCTAWRARWRPWTWAGRRARLTCAPPSRAWSGSWARTRAPSPGTTCRLIVLSSIRFVSALLSSVADPGCLSRIRIFFHPGSAWQNLSILTQKIFTVLSSRKCYID